MNINIKIKRRSKSGCNFNDDLNLSSVSGEVRSSSGDQEKEKS